jgi:hypothetical protein
MQTEVQDYFNGLCCPPIIEFNFDVDSSSWSTNGITDQNSFNLALGVSTSAFLLSGNNIKATITSYFLPINQLLAGNKNITNVNYFTAPGAFVLDFTNNLLTDFNPSKPITTTISQILFNSNNLNNASYTSMETWANGLHNIPGGTGAIDFRNNIDSVSGTNLETILTSKGWVLNV